MNISDAYLFKEVCAKERQKFICRVNEEIRRESAKEMSSLGGTNRPCKIELPERLKNKKK